MTFYKILQGSLSTWDNHFIFIFYSGLKLGIKNNVILPLVELTTIFPVP